MKEDSSWSCPQCGCGGSCVRGDESMALAIHVAMAHGSKK